METLSNNVYLKNENGIWKVWDFNTHKSTKIETILKENAELRQTVSQRNVQVADLKHRLEEKETEIRELKTFWTGNVE